MRNNKKMPQFIRRPINEITNIESSLKFRVEESYKVIRANLIFSIMKQGCKKIVFTSARPNEGKTSTAVNIAVTMASADYKVLLIDADLRKPKVHQYFNLPIAPGLTNYLGSMVDASHPLTLNAVVQKTSYQNLYVLPAGSCPANPAELLASEPMNAFLQELGTLFDYILLDTPPINVVSDALPLIKQTDGVVSIVRSNASTYPEVDKMVQSLAFINGNILGFVLTALESDTKNTQDEYSYYSYAPNRNRSKLMTDKSKKNVKASQRAPQKGPIPMSDFAAARTPALQDAPSEEMQAKSANTAAVPDILAPKNGSSYLDTSSFNQQK